MQSQKEKFIIKLLKNYTYLDEATITATITGNELINNFWKGTQGALLIFAIEKEDIYVETEVEAVMNIEDLYMVYMIKKIEKAIGNKVSSEDVMIGEASTGKGLESLANAIAAIYNPVSKENQQRQKFTQTIEKNLASRGLEVDLSYDVCMPTLEQLNKGLSLRTIESLKPHASAIVSNWINSIDAYIDNDPSAVLQTGESITTGPVAEIGFWCRRKLELTKVCDQLAQEDCRDVLIFLAVVFPLDGKDVEEGDEKENIHNSWVKTNNKLTNALNEANDNVRFLKRFEVAMQPLYTEDAAGMKRGLPNIFTVLNMISSLSRHYCSHARILNMFIRISTQLVNRTKELLEPGPQHLWGCSPDIVIKDLRDVLDIFEEYKKLYLKTAEKIELKENPEVIFGKINEFSTRLNKLADIFSCVNQFNLLESQHIDGIEDIIFDFKELLSDFKRKKHNILDYRGTAFERDYVQFTQKNAALENRVQKFIGATFAKVPNICRGIGLLKKFQLIMKRESLQQDINNRFIGMFRQFGKLLESVRTKYEKHKEKPPYIRNMPRVTTNIMWSRQLLRKILDPMNMFKEHPKVFQSRECRRIVRAYNRLARTLIEFETLYFNAWSENVAKHKRFLQARLIVRHNISKELYANFDRRLISLCRDARFLMMMGMDIPQSAKVVLLLEKRLKRRFVLVQYFCRVYNETMRKTSPVIKNLLKPHIKFFNEKLYPGLHIVTWTSFSIDVYMTKMKTAINNISILASHINDFLSNRVRANLKIIAARKYVKLDPQRIFTIEEFREEQTKNIQQTVEVIKCLCSEVELSIDDLIKKVKEFPAQDRSLETPQNAWNRVRHYYQEMTFHAIIKGVQNSLKAMEQRINARRGKVLFLEVPLFRHSLTLQIPDVTMKPSLDEMQEVMTTIGRRLIETTKEFMTWGVSSDGSTCKKVSFFNEVASHPNVCIGSIILAGAILDTREYVQEDLTTYDSYAWLWTKDPKQVLASTSASGSTTAFNNFVDQLQNIEAVENEIAAMCDYKTVVSFTISLIEFKQQLTHECERWKHKFGESMHDGVRRELETLVDEMDLLKKKMKREVKDFSSLKNVMDALSTLRDKESYIEMVFVDLEMKYTMLDKYVHPDSYTKDETDSRQMIRSMWRELHSLGKKVVESISKIAGPFREELIDNVKQLKRDLKNFRIDYDTNGPMPKGKRLPPQEAISRLGIFSRSFESLERKYDLYSAGERLFGLEVSEVKDLPRLQNELKNLKSFYDLYSDVLTAFEEFNTMPWLTVIEQIEEMRNTTENFQLRMKKLNKTIKKWDVFQELNALEQSFLDLLPLIGELSKPSIKPRHWIAVKELTGCEDLQLAVDGAFDLIKLQTVREADILEYQEDVEEICDGADQQLRIESQLEDLNTVWENRAFEFAPFKARGDVILQAIVVNEVIEALEDSQTNLAQMLTMRHVKPFREQASGWLKKLSETNDMLESWIRLQMLWMSLEAVFTSGDIARQMPVITRLFLKVDKEFVSRFMAKARETKLVTECCLNEYMRNILPSLYSDLEQCQKALDGYLENKRNKFPRFYFVSNPALLMILSQGSDKVAVQGCFPKVFDSISIVTFKGDNVVAFKAVSPGYENDVDVEELKLSRTVTATGNIEDWLGKLEKEMKRSIHREIKMASEDVKAKLTIQELAQKHCAQASLIAVQFLWTTETEEALKVCKSNKGALSAAQENQNLILKSLSSMTTEDIKRKMDRRKIETLVTIQVHQKDVLDDICKRYEKRQIKEADDFEWQKQLRCYWNDDDNTCVVEIADVPFIYCWEYLGCKERLVVTPLTDRCYISLTQALGMFYGGAPAGPAGTGKTETVKDLGRALGKYVVVFNCSDQMRYKDTAKIYKGLCQSGSWGCFDEFNRIDLEVLSVVAQQISAILTAMRGRSKTFFFPGDVTHEITLNPRCGFFITMNPGYAGRQELPENLKALFRSVAMMVPDSKIIIKVKLASVGYFHFEFLSEKFYVCYTLCQEQLSKQRHYDFGLRNILSVLRTMGTNLRQELDAGNSLTRQNLEEMLLMRTLRDMNLSKFVGEDVGLFLSLLDDLFPGQSSPPKAKYPAVETAIEEICKKRHLLHHEGWISKVIQLYETSLVRHGLMMIGPAGGGKTCAILTLLDSLTIAKEKKHYEKRLNPKAMRAEELFGENDPISGEWTDGVFSSVWSKYNDSTRNQNTWIVCDGPVDAVWIENLNTVLDDNKLLTLANGDRIPMTANVKILFEAEDLRNASPATVSRAGIVFVSASDLGFQPLMDTWILTRRKEEQKILNNLYKKYFIDDDIFDWAKKNTTKVFHAEIAHLLVNLCNLMTAMLKVSLENQNVLASTVIEKFWIYAIAWTIGGLYERANQIKISNHICEVCVEKEILPPLESDETIFEYYVTTQHTWVLWKPDEWIYPEVFKFNQCLIATQDSTRSIALLKLINQQEKKPVLVLGSSGTGKSSTVLQFCQQSGSAVVQKVINFSSATTCKMFQDNVESDIEKRQGKTFGPPAGRSMIVFLDDISMPEVNLWGDQPTLEIVRQIVEYDGFYFLEKDKRGEFKIVEGLTYMSAMSHPGGGRNDIPNRLKRHFFTFNLTPPSKISIDNIYGSMMRGRWEGMEDICAIVPKLTMATIDLWGAVKARMLPTPSKFHYIFTMFDLSRVFQGILHPPEDIIEKMGAAGVIDLWKHECLRVFCDKLTSLADQEWTLKSVQEIMTSHFGEEVAKEHGHLQYFVDFLRPDVLDPETDEVIELAPKIYEAGPSFDELKVLVTKWLKEYNNEPKLKEMPLVLFDDAVKHCLRIVRLLSLPRSSGLLVGVGGSGRQSLTRLAAYISRHTAYQIALTRSYKVPDLLEDIRIMATMCGKEGKKVTWIFTDSEIIFEEFLEYINALLAVGHIAGLFPKEERDMMAAECRKPAQAEIPGFEDTVDNLREYLAHRIRDNFHIILAFSPANKRFSERARKFPSLISGCTIDWFLKWPEDALINVSSKFIRTPEFLEILQIKDETLKSVTRHVANVHDIVVEATEEYFNKFRRHVYVTPKSYLSFIKSYKEVYTRKVLAIDQKADSVTVGLEKIAKASQDVEQMKSVLANQKVELAAAEKKAGEVMVTLAAGAQEAGVEKTKAEEIETEANNVADVINAEKEVANRELQAALPFMTAAVKAAKSIKKNDISVIARLSTPPDLIKRIMDCILILFYKQLRKVEKAEISVNKKPIMFIQDSYKQFSLPFMSNPSFVPGLMSFAEVKKDFINEETMELLEPYLGCDDFYAENAKKVSGAAEGLCKFCRAMFDYHNASLIVGPRMKALAIKEQELEIAMAKLNAAQASSKNAQDKLDKLQADYQATMDEKAALQRTAVATEEKMSAATKLINSLDGERVRWKEDAAIFLDSKTRLVGDVAVGCAFVSYCGPFNQKFRKKLTQEYFYRDCTARDIPCTRNLDVNKFLVDDATVAEWNVEGLPKDELSIQNGILTTQATRWPLIVDPQSQAVSWLMKRCQKDFPIWGTTTLSNKRLRDQLEFTMCEGKTLLVEGVENELDPLLDPVLERNTIKKGKSLYIMVGDQAFVLDKNFKMYFLTKLSNPHFSPELSAKTTVIDFAVTQKGLEDQLLSRVINVEQQQLEEQRKSLIAEVNNNTISLLALDKLLLERLSASKGDLLEDVELIKVLANTKTKATEVKLKIQSCQQTEITINKKREQYRPVAERGSVLYFVIVDMQKVNWMYQTALSQFLKWFDFSLQTSEAANLVGKRVTNIINFCTFHVYENVDRALFGLDKQMFKIMISSRIAQTAGRLTTSQMEIFLKCGSVISAMDAGKPPAAWLQQTTWLNIKALSAEPFFSDIVEAIKDPAFETWYNLENPEEAEFPSYEEKMGQTEQPGYYKMAFVRALRPDRTLLAATGYIAEILGQEFVEPLTVTMTDVWESMDVHTPCILMLTPGADPTQILKDLARSRHLEVNIVSMGEGQEPYATKAIEDGVEQGNWALLQNCHLGLNYMAQIPDALKKIADEQDIDPEFRLFLTCEPHNQFPVGLLQLSVKVTQEAPQGMKAGLLRTYTVVVDRDRLERVDKKMWRDMIFVMSFLHSTVQERRKFGAIGFNIPYEFNQSDLEACLSFLEKHMFNFASINWPTVQYQICEAQYGGRITDDFDRRLFNCYGYCWLAQSSFSTDFSFMNIKNVFNYVLPVCKEVEEYRTYIDTLPMNDNPEIFGLHTNADITYGTTSAINVLNAILDTQPKDSSGGGGLSREDIVKQKCRDMLDQMPEDYVEAIFRDKIKKRSVTELQFVLGRKDVKNVDGFSIPLNVFLYQEIVRMQGIMNLVRDTLSNLIQAIDGVVIMTPQLSGALDQIYNALPPKYWYIDASGAQIAWILPSLSLWFQGLLLRYVQLDAWLTIGRPNVYWMTGLFNPQGFLTAMRQEVTRRHKMERWALDDIVMHTEITEVTDIKKVKHPAEEGVFVRGIFLDGCGWDTKSKILVEPKPKELYQAMPVLHVTAYTSAKEAAFLAKSKHNIYRCPVYTVSKRTDLNYVFVIDTPTKKPAGHWILRGVCMLCSKD